MTRDDIRAQGRLARDNGAKPTSNPHEPNSPAWGLWVDGWWSPQFESAIADPFVSAVFDGETTDEETS